jgi:hypothetical protein
MNRRFAKIGNFPLFSLAILAAAGAAIAQISDVPPVKMGLWQTEATSNITGVENTPLAAVAKANAGRVHVSQSCLTPESWKKDIQGFNEKQRNSNCTMTNVHQDPHQISFDETCDSERGSKNTSHFQMLIDDPEHAHGNGTMTITESHFPQPMKIDMTIVSHYMGSNCGDVKPDEGKVIK